MNKATLDGSVIVVKRARGKEAETPPPSYLDKLAMLRTRDELGNSEVVCDGIVPTALVEGMQDRHRAERMRGERQGPGHLAEAEASAARIVAGQMIDVYRSIEMQRATALAARYDIVGVSVGSMRSHRREISSWLECEACSELVTRRWHVKTTPGNTYISALVDMVCIRQMAVEPSTAGKDIDALLAELRQVSEAPPNPGDYARTTYNKPVPKKHLPGAATTRGNTTFTAIQAAAAVPAVEPPPWAVSDPYLLKARKAARAERHRTGAKVCFFCACGPNNNEKRTGEQKREREREAFLEWARLAPSESNAHGIEEANNDIFGRNVAARGICGQTFRHNYEEVIVVTVAPTRTAGTQLVAFVRNAEDAEPGIGGCRELSMNEAIRRRILACQRVPVNGEHVTSTDIGTNKAMAEDERADAVHRAKAFFAFNPDEEVSMSRLERLGFTVSEAHQIADSFRRDERNTHGGTRADEATRKRARTSVLADERRGRTIRCKSQTCQFHEPENSPGVRRPVYSQWRHGARVTGIRGN